MMDPFVGKTLYLFFYHAIILNHKFTIYWEKKRLKKECEACPSFLQLSYDILHWAVYSSTMTRPCKVLDPMIVITLNI